MLEVVELEVEGCPEVMNSIILVFILYTNTNWEPWKYISRLVWLGSFVSRNACAFKWPSFLGIKRNDKESDVPGSNVSGIWKFGWTDWSVIDSSDIIKSARPKLFNSILKLMKLKLELVQS